MFQNTQAVAQDKNSAAYNIPSSTRFIKLPTVMAMTALSRSSVYRLVAEGKLPQMRKLSVGGRASGWLLSDIENYINSRSSVGGAA